MLGDVVYAARFVLIYRASRRGFFYFGERRNVEDNSEIAGSVPIVGNASGELIRCPECRNIIGEYHALGVLIRHGSRKYLVPSIIGCHCERCKAWREPLRAQTPAKANFALAPSGIAAAA